MNDSSRKVDKIDDSPKMVDDKESGTSGKQTDEHD
jgi:hypothetical protein